MTRLLCENVHHEPLQPAVTEAEYALHLAALEWSLAEPIITVDGRTSNLRKTGAGALSHMNIRFRT
jgi:hypothetical protein